MGGAVTETAEAGEKLDLLESTFAQVDALIYRCKNDENYTMSTIVGRAKSITGYETDDIVGNKRASWVEITHADDKERVFAVVDEAIDAGQPWDLDYRIVTPEGASNWVRERGCAVYENGELTYLQGLVVRADAEVELRNSIETTASAAEAEKKEIVNIAKAILTSIKTLSLLAINARIEAAHCGTAGQGFAVIAEEISRLADDNAVHARQIADRMNETKSRDSAAVDTANAA